MGSIALREHIIDVFSTVEETSEDINSRVFLMKKKGLKERKRAGYASSTYQRY
jgi:hypothetical protein